MKVKKLILIGILLVAIPAEAQQPGNPTQVQVQRSADTPLYKITVNVIGIPISPFGSSRP